MSDERFETLLGLYVDGEATSDDVAELVGSLRQDRQRRRMLVESFLLDVHLREMFVVSTVAEAALPSGFRRVGKWLAVAAAVLILASGLLVYFFRATPPKGQTVASSPPPSTTPPADQSVESGEILMHGVAVTRVPDDAEFEVGPRGNAVIRLPDGSRATLLPATRAVLRRPGEGVRRLIAVDQGGGTFQVAQGEGEFRVSTPVGTVTALGTEFSVVLRAGLRKPQEAVAVTSKIRMAVAVTDGAVQVEAGGKSYKVVVGQQRLFGDDGEQNNVDDGQQGDEQDTGNRAGKSAEREPASPATDEGRGNVNEGNGQNDNRR
jgi:ferric-dicitrate binding protein FerR (iron transport regulator)